MARLLFYPCVLRLDKAVRCRYKNLDMVRRNSEPTTADRMARERVPHRRPRPADQSSDHGALRRTLRPFALRISQANILSAISYMGKVRPAEVSRILRIEKSTLSRDVELMKQRGWLESEPPAGGRNQMIRLTADGKNLLGNVQPSWEKAQAEAKRLIGEDGEWALHQVAIRLRLRKVAFLTTSVNPRHHFRPYVVYTINDSRSLNWQTEDFHGQT